MRKIDEIGKIGSELIREVEGLMEDKVLDTIAKTFSKVEKLKPLTAFFLGATIVQFHENEEVNYDTVSRVFDEIYKLQLAIFNIMVSGTQDEDSLEPGESDVVLSVDILEENLYTAGGEYRIEGTSTEFIGFFHIHPEKGPMVGPKHVSAPHAYLVPLYDTRQGMPDPNQNSESNQNSGSGTASKTY